MPVPSYSTGSLVAGQPESVSVVKTALDEVKSLLTAGLGADNLLDGAVSTAKIAASAVDASRLAQSLLDLLCPPGEIKDYAGASLPAGYLWCDGAAVSRSTYARLFSAIGTAFGVGDGATTFNLPDLRGRVSLGVGARPGGSTYALAAAGGAETHALSVGEMPSHDHGGATGGGTTGGHSTGRVLVGNGASGGSNIVIALTVNTGNAWTAANVVEDHTHAVPALAIFSQGGGGAHNNLQPYAALNKIIRHGN